MAGCRSPISATGTGASTCWLHAAGLEISRAIADKDQREFDLVFDVKSDGWFNLMHAAGDMPIGATVVFSSVACGSATPARPTTARRTTCCASSHPVSARRARKCGRSLWTGRRGVALAWRLVARSPKVMAMAGIETLAPEAGISWIKA